MGIRIFIKLSDGSPGSGTLHSSLKPFISVLVSHFRLPILFTKLLLKVVSPLSAHFSDFPEPTKPHLGFFLKGRSRGGMEELIYM